MLHIIQNKWLAGSLTVDNSRDSLRQKSQVYMNINFITATREKLHFSKMRAYSLSLTEEVNQLPQAPEEEFPSTVGM